MSRIYDSLKRAQSGGDLAQLASAGVQSIPTLNEGDAEVAAPSVSEFPHLAWNPDFSRLLSDESSDLVGVEQFRSLRSRMYQLQAKEHLKIVLICSALPEEGKTFVAANLAMAAAKQVSRKVLLIDADLRKPNLHVLFGAPSAPGLHGVLAGTSEVAEAIQSGSIENLWFMPGGAPAANAAELIGGGRTQMVLQSLASSFDWIFIDSSPVLPVSDAVLLSRSCDGVLLVARSGITPHDALQQAQQQFRDARILGVVLNAATEHPRHGSYYYHYSGYSKKSKATEHASAAQTSLQG